MLEFLRRLLGGAKEAEPGSLVEELWIADLSSPEEGRFLERDEADYAAHYAEGGLYLSLAKPGIFAWTEASLYRYADFALEGELRFERGAPYAAQGFLFRYQDEDNFYALLLSNKGYLRLDLVFNGKPRVLVPWTEIQAPPAAQSPQSFSENGDEKKAAAAGLVTIAEDAQEPDPDRHSLGLIARGGHFTIIVDERWVAEAADQSFALGMIAFAAQRYADLSSLEKAPRFRLESCLVESRPIEVEAWYYRWNYYIIPEDAARLELARGFFSMDEQLSAAVQLQKIERRRPLEAEELFLKAEVSIRLGLTDEALAAIEACLALQPDHPKALEEKANLLYLAGKFPELRDWLRRLGPALEESPRLSSLAGHASFALGDFSKAAADYRAAAALEWDQPLFRMNEARAWDQAGERGAAAEAYKLAARLFLEQGADEDFALALGRLRELAPGSPVIKELQAHAFFTRGRTTEAARLLDELGREGCEDSALHYLRGIILTQQGEREKALERFAKAAHIEPDYPLYAFRLAETLYLLGRPARAAITRALELAPRDGWVLNLAGQEALSGGELEGARDLLSRSCAALPGVPEPAMNLAELESQSGDLTRALSILGPFAEHPGCRNLAGNCLVRAAEKAAPEESSRLYEEALREYEAAVRLDPRSGPYRDNLAAVLIELGQYGRAQSEIGQSLDLGAEPGTYLLAGKLGLALGERPRAEAAYRLGLELEPGNRALLSALVRLYLSENRDKDMFTYLELLREREPEQARILDLEIEKARTESLSCVSCGRTWSFPRELPAQSVESIRAMPPDDSPAGACPSCGKIYCIQCRKDELSDSRFICPGCKIPLKLSDHRLRWLVRQSLARQAQERPDSLSN